MMWKKVVIICLGLAMLLLPLPEWTATENVQAFSNQIIQKGSSGSDVIELQSRLQYLGYYNGEIDGVFGWGTYWAVRNFQYEFGLKVDGLVGEEVKTKLIKASNYDEDYVKEQIRKGNEFTHYGGTPKNQQTEEPPQGNQNNQEKPKQPTAVNIPSGYSQNDIQLMANAVHGEARGESYVGQVAVAAVILNRISSPSFPNSVSGVIFEPRAFTAVADGQIWLTPDETAKQAVIDAINGWDPSGQAVYYFNPNTATSSWIWSRPQIKQIGKHIFCK